MRLATMKRKRINSIYSDEGDKKRRRAQLFWQRNNSSGSEMEGMRLEVVLFELNEALRARSDWWKRLKSEPLRQSTRCCSSKTLLTYTIEEIRQKTEARLRNFSSRNFHVTRKTSKFQKLVCAQETGLGQAEHLMTT